MKGYHNDDILECTKIGIGLNTYCIILFNIHQGRLDHSEFPNDVVTVTVLFVLVPVPPVAEGTKTQGTVQYFVVPSGGGPAPGFLILYYYSVTR